MPAVVARNLRLYPWYLASTYEGISNAVWYLYLFTYKGLSLGEMALLVLLGDGVIVLAEVPTGYIADRLGRRFSVLTGIVLQALSALLFIFGAGFWHFWLAMAVCGLGDTFRSGADQALLYDSCLAVKQRDRFRPLLAHSMFVATVVMIASQIAGGIIATRVSWELPFWLEVGFSAVGFTCVWLMVKPPLNQDEPEGDEPMGRDQTAPGKANRTPRRYAVWLALLPVAAFATVVEVVPELAHFHLPAELNQAFGLTPEQFGFLLAAFELAQGLGNKLAGHRRFAEPRRVLPWVASGMLVCLLLFSLRSHIAGLTGTGLDPSVLLWGGAVLYCIARLLIDFLFGLTEPLLSEETNRRTRSNVRATALSVINAARRLVPLGILPLSTALIAGQGYPAMYAILIGSLVIPFAICTWWLVNSGRGEILKPSKP